MKHARKTHLPLYLTALAAACASLGYAWWTVHHAWRNGYGDGDMSWYTQADPRGQIIECEAPAQLPSSLPQ